MPTPAWSQPIRRDSNGYSSVYRVKAVCSDEWEFVEAVRKYPMLVEVVDKPSGVYIFFDGRWKVAKMGRDGYPRYRGAFTSLHSAVYNARKG